MAAHKAPAQHPESLTAADETGIVLTIEQAARKLGIGRTTMYALVMSGEVRSVTIGRLRRVPTRCLDDYVSGLLDNTQTMIPAA